MTSGPSDNPFETTSAEPPHYERADLVLASLSKRALGRLLDSVLVVAIAAAVGFWTAPQDDLDGVPLVFSVLITVVLQGMLIATRAQSFGKIMMGTMIVDNDGIPVGLIRGVLLREVPLAFLRQLTFPLRLFNILDALYIFRDERRCLHDYLAGTRVIDVAASRRSGLNA